jgi:uncharacterized protein YjaZ
VVKKLQDNFFSMKIYYHIKENSLIARLSAYKLNKTRCATVVGHTIYLWGISKKNFLEDKAYLNHELQHIMQYQQLGTFGFLISYVMESIRNGYYNNKFEIEAREAANLPCKAEYVLKE